MRKISAIITTCNRDGVISNAIESVLRQSYKCHEIIVVDDFSDDHTEEIVSEYVSKYPNILYERLPKRSGACRARNRAREIATGELIAGLDDDDEWCQNRIELLLSAYDESLSFVTSQDILVFEHRNVFTEKPEILTLNELLYENCVGNQVLVSKKKLDNLGGFDENLPSAQDYDMWIRLINSFGNAKAISTPTQRVYMGGQNNRITNSKRKASGYFMAYKKHKRLMTSDQRRFQLSKLQQHKEKKPTFLTFITLMSTVGKSDWFWYYVKSLEFFQPLRKFSRTIRNVYRHK